METKTSEQALQLPLAERTIAERTRSLAVSVPSDALNMLNKSRPFYMSENFQIYFAAIGINVILAAIVMMQWTTVPIKVLFAAPFPFYSALFIWNAPIERKQNRLLNPHLYLMAQTLLVTLIVSQSPIFAIMLFYPLSVQAMLKIESQKTAVLWICLFASITVAACWIFQDSMNETFAYNAVVMCGGFFFFGVFGSMLARIRRNREEIRYLLTDLVDTQAELLKYAEQSKQLAVASERERLARDLHDTLGHRLTVAAVQLEGTRRLMEQKTQHERVVTTIESAHRQLIQGMKELRAALTSMHSMTINDGNLARSLRNVVTEFTVATGIIPHIHLPGTLPSLSNDQCNVMYRFVQEALTNVQKHAQARNVWVNLDTTDDTVILSVGNDGRDFAPAEGEGYGLRGMRERAAQLDGAVRVTIPAGGGTLMMLRLPLAKAEAEWNSPPPPPPPRKKIITPTISNNLRAGAYRDAPAKFSPRAEGGNGIPGCHSTSSSVSAAALSKLRWLKTQTWPSRSWKARL